MGFLSNNDVQNILREEKDREWEAWAIKYPFCADVILGNFTEEEMLKRYMSGCYE